MDDPPAPILCNGQVRVPPPHQPRGVKQSNRDHGQDKDAEQLFVCSLGGMQRRPQRAEHQTHPEKEPDKQHNLPEAAQFNVLKPLVPKPEIGSAL